MVCQSCGFENGEEAVFCQNCGNRVDGMKVCPECKSLNARDARFCKFCGHKLIAKESTIEIEDSNISTDVLTQEHKKYDWRKILEIIGGTFSLMGIVSIVIFVFLIGVKMNKYPANHGNDAIGSFVPQASQTIFYYLGECYDTLSNTNAYSQFTVSSFLFPMIIGTLTVVALLISTITLSIVAFVRFISKISGNSNKDYASAVLATYFVYIMGVALFYMFSSASSKSILSEQPYSTNIVLNQYTVIGIALATVLTAIFIGTRIAINARELIKNKNLSKTVTSAVSLVLLCVAMYLATAPQVVLPQNTATSSIKISTSAFNSIYVLAIFYESLNGNFQIIPNSECGLLVLLGLLQYALVILIAICMLCFIRNLISNKNSSYLGCTIPLVVNSILLLVIDIVANLAFWEYLNGENSILKISDYNFTLAIGLVIVSLFLLITSILNKVFKNFEYSDSNKACPQE